MSDKPLIESSEVKKKPDCYSLSTSVVDFATTAFGNFYMGASFAEIFSSNPNAALAAGIVFCGFSVCSTYAHLKLNTHMQENQEGEVESTLAALKSKNLSLPTLTKSQYGLLAGDYLAHVGQYAGAIIAGCDKVIDKITWALPSNYRIAVNMGALAISFWGAIGNVRTCANAMRMQNLDTIHFSDHMSRMTPAESDEDLRKTEEGVGVPTVGSINSN